MHVKGLNTFVVKSEAEIAAVLEVGGRWSRADFGRPDWHVYTEVGSSSSSSSSSRSGSSGSGSRALNANHLPVAQVGKRNRSVGATLMNQDSSRSHSVFTVTIEAAAAASSSTAGNGGGGSIRVRAPSSRGTWFVLTGPAFPSVWRWCFLPGVVLLQFLSRTNTGWQAAPGGPGRQ